MAVLVFAVHHTRIKRVLDPYQTRIPRSLRDGAFSWENTLVQDRHWCLYCGTNCFLVCRGDSAFPRHSKESKKAEEAQHPVAKRHLECSKNVAKSEHSNGLRPIGQRSASDKASASLSAFEGFRRVRFLSTSAGFSRSRNLSPFQRCEHQLCRGLRWNSRNPSLFEWRVSDSENV